MALCMFLLTLCQFSQQKLVLMSFAEMEVQSLTTDQLSLDTKNEIMNQLIPHTVNLSS